MSTRVVIGKDGENTLNLPWLICFVASANTANNSTMILIIVSVIAVVSWIAESV